MSKVLDGIGASEGIGAGRVHILNWGVPEVPHRSIDSDEVEGEVEHLREVFEWAKKRLLDIEDSTEERLGAVEARIFEPQLLMLEDPELIEGATLYIRENRLSAARAGPRAHPNSGYGPGLRRSPQKRQSRQRP